MSILTDEEVQRIREDIFRQFAIPKEMISGEEPQSAIASLSERERNILKRGIHQIERMLGMRPKSD